MREIERFRTDASGRWATEVRTVQKRVADPAFEQQKPVLDAFYADFSDLVKNDGSELSLAIDRRDADTAFLEWSRLSSAYASLETLEAFIEKLPSLSRQDALDDIESFLRAPTTIERCRSVLNAYMHASDETRTRFPVDLKRAADIDQTTRDLPQIVSHYVAEDDCLSAYTVELNNEMVADDLQLSLIPFKASVYDKSHPGR